MPADLKKYKLAFLIIFFLSCTQLAEIKFDKEKWNERIDVDFPSAYREEMLSELLRNHKLVGLKYSQLIEMLGSPNFRDSNYIWYTIKVDYGNDIDPVYTKNLNFLLSRDSTILSYKVQEWKK
ncbi:MAG TPA: hypothetical protein VK625_00590 [Flavitalea sp.]|nr:hypothetical protein [Flavitalea sp.]